MNRATVGAKWTIKHITDRVVLLEKEDYAYRQVTGRDGFVLTRVEPEESRSNALDRAIQIAEANDAKLGLMLGKKLLPVDFIIKERAKKGTTGLVVPVGNEKTISLNEYKMAQKQLARVFGVPGQEPTERRYKP